MSDPFLTLKFAQSLGQQRPLTQIGQGIAEVGGIWRQAEQQREQERLAAAAQQGHQNALQRYMVEPTAENKMAVFQTGQAIGQDFETTQGMIGAVEQQRAEEAEAEALALLQNEHQQNMRDFLSDRSPENRARAMETGSQLGRFEDIDAQLELLDDSQKQELVKNNMRILAALENNNPGLAIEEAKAQRTAIESAGMGDSERAEDLDTYIELMEDGKWQEASSHINLMTGRVDEYGPNALDNLYELREEGRREREDYANFITKLVDTEISDPARREEVRERAMKLPNPELASLAVDMLSLAEDAGKGEGLTANQLQNARLSWRQQFNRETKDFKRIGEQVATVRQAAYRSLGMEGAGEFDEAQGAADLTLVNAFQRLIDPATVREADIKNIQSTIGGFDAVKRFVSGFTEGDKLSPTQRRALLTMAEQIKDVYREQEETTREVIGQNIRDFNERLDDPTAFTEESIMGDPLFADNEETVEKEVRSALKGIYPTESQQIDSFSWDEIRRNYSNTIGRMGVNVAPKAEEEEEEPTTGTGEPETRNY